MTTDPTDLPAEKVAPLAEVIDRAYGSGVDDYEATYSEEGRCIDSNLARAAAPLVAGWLAEAWDRGRAAERRDWEFTFDLTTPDEDRQPLPNPYRTDQETTT